MDSGNAKVFGYRTRENILVSFAGLFLALVVAPAIASNLLRGNPEPDDSALGWLMVILFCFMGPSSALRTWLSHVELTPNAIVLESPLGKRTSFFFTDIKEIRRVPVGIGMKIFDVRTIKGRFAIQGGLEREEEFVAELKALGFGSKT